MTRVALENACVDFPIYGAQRSLRKAIFQRAAGGIIRHEGKNQERIVVRALDDVSLQLEEGDRLGLIGHNGSGKSTLLKVIAGIYEPIAGKLSIEGRVTPLFDMLPGLDIEDTGYENIFTAGMLLGMSREYLDEKIPEIEEFCELGEYLALPVRTYSMGMTMRLGFAVVTALDPGILLMDEGFGTGDLRFTERAAERIDNFISRSRIIVLASHSDAMIKSICNKAAIMEQGRIISIGPVDEVIEEYHALVHKARAALPAALAGPSEPPVYKDDCIEKVGIDARLARGTGDAWFTRFGAYDEQGQLGWTYLEGDTLTLRINYKVMRPVRDLALLFRLYLSPGEGSERPDVIVSDIFEILSAVPLDAGASSSIELTLPELKLMPNQLSMYVWLGRADRSMAYDTIDTNVSLPRLVIKARSPQKRPLRGIMPLGYELRKSEFKTLDLAAVAHEQ